MAHCDPEITNRAPLDWLSFLLADVKDGIGPFLAVFLTSARHWDAGHVGMALTAGGIATVLARTPAGALTDALRAKRLMIGGAAMLVAAAVGVMALWPAFWPVVLAQAVNGVADAVFPAALTALSLGIVGRPRFSARVGRNEAFNHAGNMLTALAAGLAGSLIVPGAVLWIAALLSVLVVPPLAALRARDINHETACGADGGDRWRDADGLRVLLSNPVLLAFIAAITLFHFANAAMLPLLGERLAQVRGQDGALFVAACIITAQAAMVPMAVLVGRQADRWGRRRIFLVGFTVLPLRGVLCTLVHDPVVLVAIQLLDGVGAGIFGALFFIVVADLTEGTGRYNLAQGAAGACWGLGAALSNAVAGYIVDGFGYDAAFLFLAACAAGALLLFWVAVPETQGWAHKPCATAPAPVG